VVTNGVAKCMLFLVVGNMVLATGSSAAADLRGLLRLRPYSSVLLLAGLFAITGSPPFGLFVSEFAIVAGAVRGDHAWVATIMLGLLAIIFAGIGAMFIGAVFGDPRVPGDDDAVRSGTESSWLVVGPLVLTAVVLMLGVYIPAPLRSSIGAAARLLGGSVP